MLDAIPRPEGQWHLEGIHPKPKTEVNRMHVHIGLVDFLTVVAYLLIAGFFLRTLAARYSDTQFGKALGFIY